MKQAMTIFNMLIYTAYSNDSGYNSSYVFVTLLIRMCPSPSCAASVMLCSSGVYCVISHTGAKTSEYALVSTGMYVCMYAYFHFLYRSMSQYQKRSSDCANCCHGYTVLQMPTSLTWLSSTLACPHVGKEQQLR